ncbi:MFS transporter [Chloroflexia bacterium SDU3-3]|nr:MFS transporter [Chloroflexia bacterium SDU3-3]
MTQEKTAQGMRAFMTIWLGELVSIIGSGLTGFALGVWVYQSTGSATLFALISLFTTLPGILVAPLAGALVDRWDRRMVMFVADTGAALCTLAIATLLWSSALEVWHIYIAMGIASLCGAFQQPAYKVAATLLVPRERFGQASGLMQIGNGAQYIISPVIAGLLVGVVGIKGVVLVDFATYFCAMFALLAVRIPRPAATEAGSAGRGSIWGEIAQCWHYLRQRSGLLSVIAVLTFGNFMTAFISVLAAPLMLSFADTAVLGLTMSIAGTGMLIGSIVLGVTGGPKRLIRGMTAAMAAGSLGMVFMGVRQDAVLITAACFVFFFSMPFVQGCYDTIIRSKVEADLQGRMFAVSSGVIQFAAVAAYVLAGPLSEYVFQPMMAQGGSLAPSVGALIGAGPGRGIALLFIVFGVLALVVTGLGYANPHMRNVERELPDVAPAQPLGEPQLVPAD